MAVHNDKNRYDKTLVTLSYSGQFRKRGKMRPTLTHDTPIQLKSEGDILVGSLWFEKNFFDVFWFKVVPYSCIPVRVTFK